jgi:hypothetical protein
MSIFTTEELAILEENKDLLVNEIKNFCLSPNLHKFPKEAENFVTLAKALEEINKLINKNRFLDSL